MRPEKEFLIREASDHLNKSSYFFLTDYKGINAEDTTELRSKLAERGAEFHVIKNSSLRLAAKNKNLPDLSQFLSGHTAIVVGGEDASGVAKELGKYFKTTTKVAVKGGILGDRVLSAEEVKRLSELPSLEAIRAKLLSLINTPATSIVTILNQPAKSLLNVLQAKSKMIHPAILALCSASRAAPRNYRSATGKLCSPCPRGRVRRRAPPGPRSS